MFKYAMTPDDFAKFATQITLWFSSKHGIKYFVLYSELFNLKPPTLFILATANYNAVREQFINAVFQYGIPVNIEYIHQTDSYDIVIYKNNTFMTYTLTACSNPIIIS